MNARTLPPVLALLAAMLAPQDDSPEATAVPSACPMCGSSKLEGALRVGARRSCSACGYEWPHGRSRFEWPPPAVVGRCRRCGSDDLVVERRDGGAKEAAAAEAAGEPFPFGDWLVCEACRLEMRYMEVRFEPPYDTHVLGEADLTPLLEKLVELATYSDDGARYRAEVERLSAAARSGSLLAWDDATDSVIFRAIDHLQHEAPQGGTREGTEPTLPEGLMRLWNAREPVTVAYELELIPPKAIEASTFTSYAGAYSVGDLLPVKEGKLIRVVESREAALSGEPATLVCHVDDRPSTIRDRFVWKEGDLILEPMPDEGEPPPLLPGAAPE